MDFYFTEAYYGTSKHIERMIDIFDKIRQILEKDTSATITNTPLNMELEDAIKEQFGFRSVSMCWTRCDETNGGAACTLTPVSNIICHSKNLKPNVVSGKTGYYDAGHKNGLVVMISPALFTWSAMTAREVCAVVLHEIGHNFDVSPYTTLPYVVRIATSVYSVLMGSKQMSDAIDAMETISDEVKKEAKIRLAKQTAKTAVMAGLDTASRQSPFAQAIFAGKHNFIEAIREKVPLVVTLEDVFMRMRSLYNMIYGKIGYVISRIRMFAAMGTWWRRLLYSPLSHLAVVSTRKREIFADSFATAYGLGPELISGLTKLENNGSLVYYRNKLKSAGVIKDGNILFTIMEDINSAYTTIIEAFDACDHGTNIDRMNKVMKKIRREIQDPDLSVKAKEELLSQVSELEKFQKSYYAGISNGRHMYLTMVVRHLVKILGGTDWIADLFPKNEA